MKPGETWEAIDGHYLILVLGFENKSDVEFVRCLTLTSDHPSIPIGGVELWHPSNLKSAKRLV